MPQVDDVLQLAKGAYQGLSFAGADWIRVGYVQSNFNSDNCHVTGLALDFGPFGFVEQYDPEWGMWIGSGKHFSFMNQARAAGRNFVSLVEALEVLLSEDGGGSTDDDDDDGESATECGTRAELVAGRRELRKLVSSFDDHASHSLQKVLQAKMGLGPLPVSPAITISDSATRSTTTSTMDSTIDSTMNSSSSTATNRDDVARALWDDLEPLMFEGRVDWTIFWRQLAYTAEETCLDDSDETRDDAEIALLKLRRSFFPEADTANVAQNLAYTRAKLAGSEEANQVGGTLRPAWLAWLRRWQALCPDAAIMKRASPKFIPREWMLVKAYEEAQADLEQLNPGDNGTDSFAELRRLQQVFSNPYEEQSEEMTRRYYRRPPSGSEAQGGVGFMS